LRAQSGSVLRPLRRRRPTQRYGRDHPRSNRHPDHEDYGKDPHERALILEQLETVEPLLRQGAAHELNAGRPLAEVVADLIEIADKTAPN